MFTIFDPQIDVIFVLTNKRLKKKVRDKPNIIIKENNDTW